MGCAAAEADALQELVDEAHHAASFARVFPDSTRGCAGLCPFFRAPPDAPLAPADALPPRDAAALAVHGWPADAGRANLLAWRFLRQHHASLPARTVPTSKPIYGMHE